MIMRVAYASDELWTLRRLSRGVRESDTYSGPEP